MWVFVPFTPLSTSLTTNTLSAIHSLFEGPVIMCKSFVRRARTESSGYNTQDLLEARTKNIPGKQTNGKVFNTVALEGLERNSWNKRKTHEVVV